jgi:hypothetical protein
VKTTLQKIRDLNHEMHSMGLEIQREPSADNSYGIKICAFSKMNGAIFHSKEDIKKMVASMNDKFTEKTHELLELLLSEADK